MKHNYLKFLPYLLLAIFIFGIPNTATAGEDLDRIKERDAINCGVGGTGGYHSNIADFQRQLCRFIAAAVLGDADKVNFVTLNAKRRFQALEEKAVDVLSRSVTWTLSRDAKLKFNFIGPVFYDGQGFIAPKEMGVTHISQLDNASVCVETATTTHNNLVDFSNTAKNIEVIGFDSYEISRKAFVDGRCNVYSADKTFLIGMALSEKEQTGREYVLLEDTLSKEPLSLVVREGDAEWADLVRWAYFASIATEEMDITSKNAATKKQSGTVAEQNLLGNSPGVGAALELDDTWVFRAVLQVGNYGEIFERTLGMNSPSKLNRGLNDLWTKGGLLYAPPFR